MATAGFVKLTGTISRAGTIADAMFAPQRLQ